MIDKTVLKANLKKFEIFQIAFKNQHRAVIPATSKIATYVLPVRKPNENPAIGIQGGTSATDPKKGSQMKMSLFLLTMIQNFRIVDQ